VEGEVKLCVDCSMDYTDDNLYCSQCGKDLEKLPDPKEKTITKNYNAIIKRIEPNHNYPILSFVAGLLVLAGIIVIVVGMFGTTVVYSSLNTVSSIIPNDASYMVPPIINNGTALLTAAIFLIVMVVFGFSLIANGEMIFLMINMQGDTSVLKQSITMMAEAITRNE
jgi:hypothetical protein